MSISNIKEIKRDTLSYTVYQSIKDSIINGDIEPGTRLTESKLSKQLNVSATPVREAFRELSSEGLIKLIPYRGAVVQRFTHEELSEVYECREALEVKAVELAIYNIDDDSLNELYSLLEKSKETSNHLEYVEVNSSIHNLILKNAKNQTLMNFMKQIQEVVMHNRTLSSYSEERKKEMYEEHKNIIDAIKNKDIENAKINMKKHIQNGFHYIKERI